jgi:hypothetical protein
MIQNLRIKYAIIASLLIGFMFTISFGLYGYTYYEIYLHSEPVYGIVENIDLDKGTTTISYIKDEYKYKNTVHFIDSGLKTGDKTTVYYDVRDPSKSFIYEQATILLFFFGVGIIFIIISILLIFIKTYKEKNGSKKANKKRNKKRRVK